MSQLFGRSYKIALGAVDVSGLRCSFEVEKSLKNEPNTATIKCWNLNEESRAILSKPAIVNVSIEAGYGNELSQIYLGQVRGGYSEVEGPDITTTLTSGDSDKAIQQARLSVPLGPKTPNQQVLLAIAQTLKVGLGNVSVAASKLAQTGKSMFPCATVLTGSATEQLSRFCHSAGLEWSIQDGKLQILDLGKGLDERPYILSSDSGLIGSPSVSWDKKKAKQVVNCDTLMLPGLRPGLRVVMDTRFVQGTYRITKCNYKGDTHGQGSDWGMRLVCESLK